MTQPLSIDLAAIGLTPADLQARVVDRMVERLLSSESIDGDGPFITESVLKRELHDRIKARVDEQLSKLFAITVIPTVDDIVTSMKIKQTNRYGEPQKEPMSLTEYAVSRAKGYMAEPVNYEGKTEKESGIGRGFSATGTRASHLVDKYLYQTLDTMAKASVKSVGAELADGIASAVRASLASVLERLQVKVEVPR